MAFESPKRSNYRVVEIRQQPKLGFWLWLHASQGVHNGVQQPLGNTKKPMNIIGGSGAFVDTGAFMCR